MKRFFIILGVALMSMTSWAAPKLIDCYDAAVDYYPAYFYSEDGQSMIPLWHIGMRGRGGEFIVVDIVDVDEYGLTHDERLNPDKVYNSVDDIVTDWSGVTLPGAKEDLFQLTGSTIVANYDEDGKISITIDCVCQSGATYHITYVDKCEMVAPEIELDFTDGKITLEDNTQTPRIRNFQIIAEIPGQLSMMVAVNSKHVEGTYTIADVIQEFSDVTWYDEEGNYSTLKMCDVSMVVTADPAHPGSYFYDIHVITKVGWGYHTKLYSTPWQRPVVPITDTVTITADNLRMMDYRESLGELMFLASSPDYSMNLYVRSQDTQGTYGNAEIDFEYNYIWYWEGETEKQAIGFAGEYTYVEEENGDRSLTGWLECSNGVHYILDLRYDHLAPVRTEEVEFEYGSIEDQLDRGGFIIQAENNDCMLQAIVFATQLEGLYSEQDIDWQATMILEYREGYPNGYMLMPLDAEIEVVQQSEDWYDIRITMTLQAEADKTDVAQYIVHMQAEYYNEYQGITNVSESNGASVIKRIENGELILKTADGACYRITGARADY